MIPLPFLLTAPPGVHVRVQGEARLRFSEGSLVSLAAAATLSPNAAGLLADVAGRPMLPVLRVASGPVAVSPDGTVRAGGKSVGRLFLAKPDGELGHPGDPSFGLLAVGNAAPPSTPAAGRLGSATVAIHAVSLIDGERVLLRDVAEVTGDPATVARLGAVDLGAIPSVGVSRSLGSWTVRAALRNQGFSEGSVILNYPMDAVVARKSQTIDVETLVAEATAKAVEFSKGDVALTIAPSAFAAPVGTAAFSAVATGSGSAVTVTLTTSVGAWSRPTVLRFLAKASVVKAGDAVRIHVERNGATLETDGKAKTGGKVGDTIQIATGDGAVLSATVTGSGQVEVRL